MRPVPGSVPSLRDHRRSGGRADHRDAVPDDTAATRGEKGEVGACGDVRAGHAVSAVFFFA